MPLNRVRIAERRVLAPSWVLDLGVLSLAVAISLGTYVLRHNLSNTVDADEILPVALVALRFGRRGGVIGAVLAVALTGVWEVDHADAAVTVFGYASRIGAFIAIGFLVGAFVDKRRRLEDQLLRYYDTSLDLLSTSDSEGRFTRVNPAWEPLLGYPIETLRGTRLLELVHPDDRAATRAEAANLREGHDTVKFRNRYRGANGSYHWLEWSAGRAHNGLTHAVVRDITAQVQAEALLDSNARMLEAQVRDRTSELDDARTETLQRLALAGEFRDDETFQHTERVGAGAAELATALGLDCERVNVLSEAAPLHDIGKLSIPDGILLKPGPLTDQERALMQGHTTAGERLLGGSRSPVLQMAAVIAASHHERWDGNGYPAGLEGEAIPLVGRIVAVADVFDALTHERPYKSAWPVDSAIAEIRQGAGSQFDPRVVSAFLAVRGVAATSRVVRADSTTQIQANVPLAVLSSASPAPLRSIA